MSSKAVFLDRDGVLIHEVNYLSNLKQVNLYSDVPESLKYLKKSGYKLIIVTNQSGVARGYFDEQFVQRTHEKINRLLANFDIQLDGIYYCPHHPDGQNPYSIICECRKPMPGMIFTATKEFKINLAESYMIGDKLSDVELAHNAKITAILLKTGHGQQIAKNVLNKYPKTPVFQTFSAAVNFILNRT